MKNEGIKGISFRNFRIFKDTCEFDFVPLTVLTGANSSGKSTVIKGLKLFRMFEENRDEDWTLHFEEGTHQLGDFEFILNEVSHEKEVCIRYTMPEDSLSCLFGVLIVENVFEPDDTNSMKNGRLKRSSIYSETKNGLILLYQAERKTSHYRYYLNKDHIRQNYIPGFRKLYGCSGNATEEDMTAKELAGCAHQLDADEYFPQPELLKLIAQIPIREYACFEQHLWTLIVRTYPEIQEKFTFDTFLELFADLDKQIRKEGEQITAAGGKAVYNYQLRGEYVSSVSVKRVVEASKAADFLSFYRALISEVIQETSVYEVSPDDANIWYKGSGSHDESFDFFREKSMLEYKNESDLKSILLYLYYFEYNLFSPFKGECVLKIRETEDRETLCSFTEKTEACLKARSYGKIRSFFKDIFFVESIRANTQRLYTYFSQGTSFNEFLLQFMRNRYREHEKRFLSKWIKEFEIGDDIDFHIVRGVGSQIFILRGNKRINVVDLGYGVTQFLPVLLHIIYNYTIHQTANGISIAVQEPETNLHPRLQSKLADLFIDAHQTFGIRFIIETHSEYFVRKLQYLTAQGTIRPEDTLIHYLDQAEPQIRKIRILPDGRLSQPFGTGFFDEADNLALELLPYSFK